MKLFSYRNIIAIFLVILHFQQSPAQNPEIHQAAALSRFTGIYSFLGSYIAVREAYFLASLVCVLVAGNVFLTFFQLPSYFLPIYHNQKRALDLDWKAPSQYLEFLGDILLEMLAFLEAKVEEWHRLKQ